MSPQSKWSSFFERSQYVRLFAIHDAEGNILEVFTSPGNAAAPRPQGRADLAYTEVTVPADLPRGDADLDN